MTDLQLISAYQGGDQSAFTQIYKKYKDRVFWFVYRYVWNKEDAEDITQDTFLRLVRFKNKYRVKEAKFSTWLYEIAKRQVFSFWQYQGAEMRDMATVSIQASQEQDNSRPIQLIDTGFSPEQVADNSICMKIYQKRMNNMENQYAEAYELYSKEFSYQEISEILNVPLNTVKSRIYRARRHLL